MSKLGNFSSVTLEQDSSTTQFWYLTMYSYTGTVYVSQIDSEGSLVGSAVLSNVCAVGGFPTEYFSSKVSDTMTVAYNTSGTNYGLQFTGVQLSNYSLCVTYVGIGGQPFTFTSTNPAPV